MKFYLSIHLQDTSLSAAARFRLKKKRCTKERNIQFTARRFLPLEFLPPFYFTYWIVIIAVIAITHEMAHGILMRLYNVKIKSTGFAFFPWFFPVFPAAFVEQDEKSMNKSTKFHQLAILSAGTFANVVTAALFLVILFGFFSLAFAPSGVVFDTYAT